MRKGISIALCAVMLAGCGAKTEPVTPEETPAAEQTTETVDDAAISALEGAVEQLAGDKAYRAEGVYAAGADKAVKNSIVLEQDGIGNYHLVTRDGDAESEIADERWYMLTGAEKSETPAEEKDPAETAETTEEKPEETAEATAEPAEGEKPVAEAEEAPETGMRAFYQNDADEWVYENLDYVNPYAMTARTMLDEIDGLKISENNGLYVFSALIGPDAYDHFMPVVEWHKDAIENGSMIEANLTVDKETGMPVSLSTEVENDPDAGLFSVTFTGFGEAIEIKLPEGAENAVEAVVEPVEEKVEEAAEAETSETAEPAESADSENKDAAENTKPEENTEAPAEEKADAEAPAEKN